MFLDSGVYLASGEDFHSEHPGWFRIIFAQEKDKLVEGLKRSAHYFLFPGPRGTDRMIIVGSSM
jgi:aspartate/methionine/tyrosine aminotransferase